MFNLLSHCFALLLQTLKHPDKRAAYDAIVGISGDAVNPFSDGSYERDQVIVHLSCQHAAFNV